MTKNTKLRMIDLLICACADAWENDKELLAHGIGLIPRLGASLAKLRNPDLLMTDSEAYMVTEPVPVGGSESQPPLRENWMGFSRVFDCVWGGKRHAMVGPSQIDKFGQANISAIGDYAKPKVQILGVRGFPGNSISHENSFFVPAHSKRVFVDGEVDTVCSIGYNLKRLPRGYTFEDIAIGRIVTNLCVMDFNGPNKQVRLLSLHPGVSIDDVLDNTGFEIVLPDEIKQTAFATKSDIEFIASVDPQNLRSNAI